MNHDDFIALERDIHLAKLRAEIKDLEADTRLTNAEAEAVEIANDRARKK